MAADPARIPVIAGVGEWNDRDSNSEQALDSAGLMLVALAAADRDAGGGWLARCQRLLVVPQISFPGLDVPALLSRGTGIDQPNIRLADVPSGDTPVRLLNDAANAIGRGEITVAAITGGEALRTAVARGGTLFQGSRRNAPELRQRYGLLLPSDIYPLYENAFRAELGQSLAEAQTESGIIWSLMSVVAAQSDGAWLKRPMSADDIVTPGPRNRPIAHPYSKLMVANSAVNQGAAIIVTSLAAAREAGIPEDRLVFIGAGAAAHESDEPLERADFTTPPAMRTSLEQALAFNSLSPDDIELVELYSCFPCVPKMARRVLDWPADRPVTVHGGLTFGGGPIANYMSHAIAAMTRRIRAGAENGFLFGNGGHCSHNHSIMLFAEPPAENPFPQDYHVQALADSRRGPIPAVTDRVEGRFPLETYTVIYDRDGAPAHGIILSRTPDGQRLVAKVPAEDARSIAFLTDGRAEPVGHVGHNRRVGDTLIWSVE